MSNYSNSTPQCADVPSDLDDRIHRARFVVYTVMPPFHFLFGLTGHCLSLLAFWKQSTHEHAYSYQIFSAISESIYSISIDAVFYTYFHWSGLDQTDRQWWFVQDHALMWYATHVCAAFLQMATTNSLLAALAMAVDRVLALVRPVLYRGFNHRLHQRVIFVGCVLFSIGTSVFDCFRHSMTRSEDAIDSSLVMINSTTSESMVDGSINRSTIIASKSITPYYKIQYDFDYLNTPFANFSSQFRNITRTVGLATLIFCNIFMIVLVKKHNRKVTHLMVDVQTKSRKKRERSLLLLAISQSICTGLAITAEVSFTYLIYLGGASFVQCGYIDLASPVVNAVIQIANASNFYLTLAINEQFRKSVLSLFPCAKKSNSIGGTTVGRPGTGRRLGWG